MHARYQFLASQTLLLALILAACGGQPPAPTAEQPTAAAPTTAAVATADVTEFATPAAPPATAPAAPDAAPSAPAAPAATTEAPAADDAGGVMPAGQHGGTVVVAMPADPGALNPAVTTAGWTHFVADQIFNGLVGLDDHLNPVPELAARWDISADGTAYTFHLQPGVLWQDGQPFTAADVKFSFEHALLKYHARTKAGLETIIQSIETPDDGTVVFKFTQPYGPLLQRLTVTEAPIIPRHIYDGKDLLTDPANLRPVGTGPFRLAEYITGDHITLERNPTYFRADLPYLNRVIFRIIPEASTAVLALEQGEVDYLYSVPGADLERLRANPELTLAQGSGGPAGSLCQATLIPNLTKAPFDTLDVRRAVYHALDRAFLVEHVYWGLGTASTGPISRQLAWAYSEEVTTYPFDSARANELLDQAGYPRGADGTRFTVTLTYDSSFARLAEAMREQLRQVGIDLALESLDFNAAVDKVFTKKAFDLFVTTYCNGPDPEIGVRRMYISTNIGPIPFSNGAGYQNAQVDGLLDQAAALTDRAERAKLYAQLQQIITADLPYFWIVDQLQYRAHRATFQGFRYSMSPFLETVSTTDTGT